MKLFKSTLAALLTTAVAGSFALTSYADHHGGGHASLESLATGAHRSAENIARNDARHPVETL